MWTRPAQQQANNRRLRGQRGRRKASGAKLLIIQSSFQLILKSGPALATRIQLSKSWANKAEMNFPICDFPFLFPFVLFVFAFALCLATISSRCHPFFLQVVQGGERAAAAAATERTHHHRIRRTPQNHQGA